MMLSTDAYLVASVTLFISLFIKVYFKYSNKFCKSQKRLDGKTCVVTGGTCGMGLEIAKEFARRGAKVIIACPFEAEGTKAQENIVKDTGNNNVIFKHLNLASLESTRKFARDILKQENRLDILVNNAGIGSGSKITNDSLNITMQINYYGHFLLTILLLPLLKKSGRPAEKSRIVNTTSLFHFGGWFQPGKMNVKHWHVLHYYPNSKLCLLLFSTELSKRLKGHNVTTNSIDPGAVGTAIFDMNYGKVLGFICTIVLRLMVKTPWEGAQTALHVALDDNVGDISGEYFRNCELRKAKKISYNDEVARTLWDESARLVKLSDIELDV